MRLLPIFHPLIENDVRAVMDRYDRQSPGLGARFRRTFYSAVDDLLEFPEKYPIKQDPGIRTKLMRPFPYFVFYSVAGNNLFILSVQYAGRSPALLASVARQRKST